MVMQQVLRPSILKPNSAGVFTVTAGNDLLHILGTNRSGVTRTAIIRKIMVYNNTGANETIALGTRDLAVAPAFVQYMPDLLCLNGMENIWNAEDIPAIEFSVLTLALALGREGNIYVLASAAAMLISLEVEEFGS